MNFWFLLFLSALTASKSKSSSDLDFDLTNLTNFPKGFIFSSATASYQVEGAWNLNGKGENIWDRITHTNPDYITNRENGDVACDSYHKFKEDVRNIKDIGFKMYRFSLSWSRLYPTGFTINVNEDGVRYYNKLIDELLQNGIEPMVTLYHWDLPQPLEEIGGWLNPNIAEIFGEYARAVFQLFGDRVKWWLTINEPQCVAEGYGSEGRAPALNLHGTGEYLSGHNIIRAHAKAYRIYDDEFKKSQKGKVSIAVYAPFFFPKNPKDPSHLEATERGIQFIFGWFAHPIFSKSGNYPDVMREYIDNNSKAEGLSESRLPTFTEEEIQEIKGTFDYISLNHYTSKLIEPGLPPWVPKPSLVSDQNVSLQIIPGTLQSGCSWLQVVPEGFRGLLKKVKDDYNNPEIFITENGYCDTGTLEDKERVHYYKEYLKQLLAAIYEDGCNIIGYTAWSLMDNFEWNDGYTKKFGLLHVDFNDPNRPRTWKLSANFFQQLIKQNTFNNLKTEL